MTKEENERLETFVKYYRIETGIPARVDHPRPMYSEDFVSWLITKQERGKRPMRVQAVLRDGAGYHNARVLKINIFSDFGKLIHGADFCLPCLMTRHTDGFSVIYQEDFSTGPKQIICENQKGEIANVANRGSGKTA